METPSPNPAPTWPVLNEAERSTVREVLIRGPRSRAEIARTLGLSKTSLTRVTRRLVDVGLLTEGDVELRGWTGRPSELMHAELTGRHFFGVKLTGDALFWVVTDLGARVVESGDEPLEDRAVDSVLDQVSAVYRNLETRHPTLTAAGVCVAGDIAMVAGRQIVLDSPFLGWHDVPVAQLLSDRWGIPVTVENDVRALTAAELWFGAGAGCESLALITVGAGVGFGFVNSGRLIEGHRGGAGRLDHLPIDPSGPICKLGHRGCASGFLPNQAIVDALRMHGVDYPGAVRLAREGNPAAVRAFGDAGHALGILIGTIANLLDPEKIVLTGDGLAVVDLARPRLDDAIASVRVPQTAPTPLVVVPFEFEEWARAGAVAGIRSVLVF
jgi:predicted NBD/HSP70 family sugar kinase